MAKRKTNFIVWLHHHATKTGDTMKTPLSRRSFSAPGFTLLETVLAIVLSGIVILFFLQSPLHVIELEKKIEQISSSDMALMKASDQITKDFSAACLPTLFSQTNAKKKTKQATSSQATDESEEKQSTSDEENKEKTDQAYSIFFHLTCNDDKIISHHFKTEHGSFIHEKPFKTVSFLSTQPLLTFGHIAPRLLRITYEIKELKDAKNRLSYQLIRHQGASLDTEPDLHAQDQDEEATTSSWENTVIILDQLSECFLFVSTPDEDANEQKKEDPPPLLTQWGETEETNNSLPSQAQLKIARWQDAGQKTIRTCELTIPLVATTSLTPTTTTVATKNESPPPDTTTQPAEQKTPRKTSAPYNKSAGASDPKKTRLVSRDQKPVHQPDQRSRHHDQI
jgi:type II secretory pathway pseudopilin PulG